MENHAALRVISSARSIVASAALHTLGQRIRALHTRVSDPRVRTTPSPRTATRVTAPPSVRSRAATAMVAVVVGGEVMPRARRAAWATWAAAAASANPPIA
jgi:hypothetical protein